MKNNLENNKLIAEFMNLSLVPCNIGTENGVVTEGYLTHHASLPFTLKGMQYKYKWDWLMPVVEKIESIGGQQVFINGCSCNILGEKHETIKGYGTKIEATYKAVVQFIKWYNSAKENTTD